MCFTPLFLYSKTQKDYQHLSNTVKNNLKVFPYHLHTCRCTVPAGHSPIRPGRFGPIEDLWYQTIDRDFIIY